MGRLCLVLDMLSLLFLYYLKAGGAAKQHSTRASHGAHGRTGLGLFMLDIHDPTAYPVTLVRKRVAKWRFHQCLLRG